MSSVKKVSDIVAEIAAACREQSSGIEQVNRAVMQMDETTQQNAALVEQSTAASQAMAEQARRLSEMMARYQVGNTAGSTPLNEPSALAVSAPNTARAPSTPTGAPRVERRRAGRPWTEKTPKPGRAGPALEKPGIRSAVGVQAGAARTASKEEWREF